MQRVLCICGVPAAGKSTAAGLVAECGDVTVIETGHVVARLLRRRPVHEMCSRDQARFRNDALALVNGPSPTPLVRVLRRRIRQARRPVVLVGVRNISTLFGLRSSRSFELRVVFIDTRVDVCARRYAERQHVSAAIYQDVLAAATEAEHEQIKRLADDLIPNDIDNPRVLGHRLLPLVHWLSSS